MGGFARPGIGGDAEDGVMASDVLGRKFLRQKACYFAPLGEGETGQGMVYAAPVEIKCRFTEEVTETSGPGGITKTFQSYAMVDRDVEADGVVVPVEFSLLRNRVSPYQNTGALRIARVSKLPDKKGKKFLRRAYF